MNVKKAFTLIELAVVTLILVIMIGISLPLINKGGSHHEAKLVANSLQQVLNIATSYARSKGKVCLIITDFSVGQTSFADPNPNKSNIDRYEIGSFDAAQADWDGTGVVYKNIGEGTDVSVTLQASIGLRDTDTPTAENTRIYVKPDGNVSTSVLDVLITPRDKPELYYRIKINEKAGNAEMVTFKDEE